MKSANFLRVSPSPRENPSGIIRAMLAYPVVGEARHKQDVSILFDLVDEGQPTDVARDKDKMIAEAVWRETRDRMDA